MNEEFDTVMQSIRNSLETGASSRKSPMHTLVVGTADGNLRVMVLREYDASNHTLRFHTDARSPKVAAIAVDYRVSVLAYDSDAKVQIRMRGRGRVETDTPLADDTWAQSTTFARRCYLAETGPSSEADAPTSGLPKWAEGLTPSEEQVGPARANFAVLLIEVQEFDWLYLSNDGHRRARVVVEGRHGEPNVHWLVP